jgi:hypothetical protein
MAHEHDPHPLNPPYWDVEHPLYTDVLFEQPVEVRFKGHITALESYVEPSLVNPLGQAQGVRSYILLYPYIVVPPPPTKLPSRSVNSPRTKNSTPSSGQPSQATTS